MANRKNSYADMERFRETCNAQKRRYYAKTSIYEPSPWTYEHDEMVLKHSITDTELSKKIHHSVKAIQQRRYRLKKMLKGEI